MNNPPDDKIPKKAEQIIVTQFSDSKLKNGVDGKTPELHIAPAKNPLIYSQMENTRSQVEAVEAMTTGSTPMTWKDLANLTSKHIKGIPDQPRDGFESAQTYLDFNQKRNELWAKEKAIFNQSPADLSFDDPELPGKKQSRILVECADGRNAPVLFMDKKDLIKRYSIEWMPFAGLIIVPEIDNALTVPQLEEKFKAEPELEKMVFARMDLLFGQKVQEFIEKKTHQSQYAKLDFEFQAHFDGHHFPHHGCGAHCSNFNNAQLETIKDCILTERWLRARFPKQYVNGEFRVYRTAHDTGDGGNVYDGALLDQQKVDQEILTKHAAKFVEAKKYLAPQPAGNQDGIIYPYMANHTEINEADHDEQTVRISQDHFAHTLVGQSVLEICWTESAANVFSHLKILLGIIEKNYRKNHPEKPAIVHLDLPEHDTTIEKVYEAVMDMIQNDAELKTKMDAGTLQIVTTVTNSQTFVSHSEKN